ncbi:MAG: chemotaxis response regulator protein-glutamate methylesterase [Sporolactobacillus sp.]|nr:chemotaxis response regulator protein-glutamate methylesterase [Sporolactobacillus sp.]
MKKIKVLIVDDSHLFREVIARGIASSRDIEVVAKAGDPREAVHQLLKYEIDVMTCDIEMPYMNGVSFIRQLLPKYPIPVVVVSSISDAVFDAVQAGAVEFIGKPDARSLGDVQRFLTELIDKIHAAARAKLNRSYSSDHRVVHIASGAHTGKRLIAVGASTGGTDALYQLLRRFPPNVPGIVVVQHIPASFSRMFADRLNNDTDLSVKEAQTGDVVERGQVFIAPGDRHMRIIKQGARIQLECFYGNKVNGHIPSVDILFNSVAKELGDQAIGVILTGMGYDGAAGLLRMKRHGATTFGQDEASSVVYGMPKAAYHIGAVTHQADLFVLPKLILQSLTDGSQIR